MAPGYSLSTGTSDVVTSLCNISTHTQLCDSLPDCSACLVAVVVVVVAAAVAAAASTTDLARRSFAPTVTQHRINYQSIDR